MDTDREAEGKGTVAGQAKPDAMEDALLISPGHGTETKLDDSSEDVTPTAATEARRTLEEREAERQADLELESELVLHDTSAAAPAKQVST